MRLSEAYEKMDIELDLIA